ncbi:MAG: glycosyltransferase [Gemmatimonadaceae bacterium]|nr:glycosyltransferase [Gemmatimonadaceae bacterium]
MSPRPSVVVPAHNAGPDLSECLRALLVSDLPRAEWELLVVDDGQLPSIPGA